MALTCPVCSFEMKPEFLSNPGYRNCAVCGSELSVLSFPACFSVAEGIDISPQQRTDEENSCFHHESRKAVRICTRCGKFLCTLCAAELGTEVLCPECLMGGRQRGTEPKLERERTLYDSIALSLAIAPVILWPFTFVGGPAALYVAIRYWRRPDGIVRKFRWRRYAALLIGVATVAFWVFAIGVAVTSARRR